MEFTVFIMEFYYNYSPALRIKLWLFKRFYIEFYCMCDLEDNIWINWKYTSKILFLDL